MAVAEMVHKDSRRGTSSAATSHLERMKGVTSLL
eukprot:CAMPEP_0194300330 /NCGR_PEP_ID=MMETSP0169-20130528/61196_1 /TAXON_ID=218684 /ORGANISM="Corethron pennatum, Strain L29A3" /LENGTH=33 /DNA_ID= /DNA_START= /DNA_END= /DNA_ORIENTATION=